MIRKVLLLAAALSVGAIGSALAESWTLDGASSKLAFGSVKKDTVGEVHSFETLSGTVGSDGAVSIDVDLSSVQTNIDIRNERMIEHVFKGVKSASLTAQLDMNELKSIAVGSSSVVDVSGALSFLGTSIELDAEMFVMRVSEGQVLVTTNDMIFVGTEDLGINAGVDKLMELADLPGITRTAPVMLRLVFNLDEQKAEAAPAAPAATTVAAVAGDVKKGKKVFRKCKACHQLKEGKNGAGPSLFEIVGAPVAQVEGFKYSKAMADSGLVWDTETLAAFLRKPKEVVPGTKMAFPGLKKEADVENLIAYLANP